MHTPQSQQPGPRVQYYRSSRRSNAAVETGALSFGPWCVIRAASSETTLLCRAALLTLSAIVNKHIPPCAGRASGGGPPPISKTELLAVLTMCLLSFMGFREKHSNPLKRLAHPTGFEPVTSAFGGRWYSLPMTAKPTKTKA